MLLRSVSTNLKLFDEVKKQFRVTMTFFVRNKITSGNITRRVTSNKPLQFQKKTARVESSQDFEKF